MRLKDLLATQYLEVLTTSWVDNQGEVALGEGGFHGSAILPKERPADPFLGEDADAQAVSDGPFLTQGHDFVGRVAA